MACPVPSQAHSCVAHFPYEQRPLWSRPQGNITGAEVCPDQVTMGIACRWHWQSSTTLVTHRVGIATVGALFVVQAPSAGKRKQANSHLHACARSKPGVGFPVTVCFLITYLILPVRYREAHVSGQSSAIISHRRCSRWGQSLLRHGQPSQHGGLIPLLRLLFLRLIPPGFLLTSQSIILLSLGGGRQPADNTPAR